MGEKISLIAGKIKANYSLSVGDAFVVASAIDERAKILTGDPEFKQVENVVDIKWLNNV